MDKKLEVFDPPMCCSSGVCGPKVDKKLVMFSSALEWLRTQGVEVVRYNPAQRYDAFAENAVVTHTINTAGTECLPLLLVDGVIVSQGSYPAKNELAQMLGVDDMKAATK